MQLPKTPPARGRSKFRNTCLKNKRNKSVNVFASRQRSTGKPTSAPEQLCVPLHELVASPIPIAKPKITMEATPTGSMTVGLYSTSPR